MKKSLIIVGILIGLTLTSIYFVGKITETKTHELIAEYNQKGLALEVVSYDRHFFSADVVTKVSFEDDNIDKRSFKVFSKITHYPYKASSVNRLEIVDVKLNEKLNSYFSTDSWFNSKEEFMLWGTVKGELSIPAGRYEKNGELLTSEPITINYKFDINTNAGDLDFIWAGLRLQTASESIALQDLGLSLSFAQAAVNTENTNWEYDYKLAIGNLLQADIKQNKVTSIFEGVRLKGGSKSGEGLDKINTHNELSIDRYQFGSDASLAFLNNTLDVYIDGLYQPALNILNENAQINEQTQGALSALINHGFNLSLSNLHSETPWGNVDAEFNYSLKEGAILPDLMRNPYSLLDFGEGDINVSLPKVFLNLPGIGDLLVSFLNSGLIKVEDQTLKLNGNYKDGELVVNGSIIPL